MKEEVSLVLAQWTMFKQHLMVSQAHRYPVLSVHYFLSRDLSWFWMLVTRCPTTL